ncbi:MAG: sulfotransferase [Bacteroidia bacterium]
MNLSVDKINSIKLNFIFCMERTGSSMFTAMLNKNENVLSTSEEPFALYLYNKYHHKKHYTKSEIDVLVNDFWQTTERNLSLYYDTKENLRESLYRYLPNIDFHFLCKIFYLHFIPLKDKNKVDVIIDKQIKFIHYIPQVMKIFPDAKILILVRNHKEVITSWKKRKLGLSDNAAYLGKVYNINYTNAKKTLDLNLERVGLIKYEELVLNPEFELKKACDFFDISYSKTMVEHHTQFNTYIEKMSDKVDPEVLKKMKDFQSNTLKPISVDLINEWEKILTKDEIAVSEKINQNLDVFYRYPKVSKTYSFTIKNRLNILLAILEKKVYHKLYIESPIWFKLMVKKKK